MMKKENEKNLNNTKAKNGNDTGEKTKPNKSKSKPKRKQKDYLKTKKTEVVDYFPRGGSTSREDFTFNTALIDKKANPESKFLNKKRKKVEKVQDDSVKAKTDSDDTKQEVQMMTDESEKSASRALIPRFKVGDLVLLTISEIRKDYMIANYTRNKKAMIHKNYSGFEDKEDFSFEKYFKIGQFICGAVVSAGNDIQLEEGYMNKKILVSIDPKIINIGLYANKLTIGMDLYGRLIKIGDSFSVDFKLSKYEDDLMRFNKDLKKEKMKQFEIESEEENDQEEGQEIEEEYDQDEEIDDEEDEINFENLNKAHASKKKSNQLQNSEYEVNLLDNEEAPELFKDKNLDSYYFFKLISLERDSKTGKNLLNVSLNHQKYKFPIKSCDFKVLRPGFLFKSNTTRELLNGVEVAFGGNIGSIFCDHLKTNSNTKKNILTRIIHVSVNSKSTSLSTKTNVINLITNDLEEKINLVGKLFENVKIENVLFGNSYEVQLTEKSSAFLHSNQIDNREENKFDTSDSIPKVMVKEYNFFDDKPMLTAKKESIDREFLTWKNLKVGKFLNGVIKEILSDKIIIKLNRFIEGILTREHITDFPLTKIPKKFKIGQQVQARIFSFDYSKKNIILTTKESYMDKNTKMTAELSELQEGEDLQLVYVGNNLFQHTGNVVGKLMNYNKIKTKENFKLGKVYKYKVYKIIQKTNKLYFTNETDVYQPGLGDYENIVRRNPILSTVAAIFNDEANDKMEVDNLTTIKPGDIIDFQVVSPKKLVKLLIKKGADVSVLKENIETMTKKYLVVKVSDNNISQKNLYGFVPVELISDFYQDKIFQILLKSKNERSLKLMVLYFNPTSKIIILTGKESLINKRENLVSSSAEIPLIKDQLYYGFINKTSKNGIIAQFLENHKTVIRFKDDAQRDSNVFLPGHTVVLRFKHQTDKKKKFDLNVYSNYNSAEIKSEGMDYLRIYREDISRIFTSSEETKKGLIKLINTQVEGKVGIIKDYGVLVSLNVSPSNTSITGFLKNEHMSVEEYNVGEVKTFRIIDVDIVNNIAYLTDSVLSEDINKFSSKEFFQKEKDNSEDFVIELFHDNYISAYHKENPSVKAIIPCNLYNFNFESSKISDVLKIGDIVNAKIVDFDENLNRIVTEFPNKLGNKIISSSKRTQGEKVKKEIIPGNIVKGRINGIKGAYVYVYIDKKTLGRIHLNNFQGDIEAIKEHLKHIETDLNKTNNHDSSNAISTNYPEELKINCRILHVESKEGKDSLKICDLTDSIDSTQEESLIDKRSRVNKELTLELDFNGEKENVGIISKIDLSNKYPIKIDHCSRNHRTVKVQIHYSYIPVENLQNIKSIYKVGEKIIFYSKNSDNKDDENPYLHSLIPFNKLPTNMKFKIDQLYPVRILKPITGRGLVAEISSYSINTEGFVDICEISDDLHPNPLNLYKPGTITLGRIINYDEKAKKYFISLRYSITSDENFDVLKNGSTLKYNKNFEIFERIGDFRNKIYKYGVDQVIESNTVAIGYITSSSEKGVFIKLAWNVIVRAALRELTDEKTTKPFLLFKPDSLIICRVISIYRPNNKENSDSNTQMNVNVSLRESVVKYNLTLRQKDLVVNNFYECLIMNINEAERKIEVCIVGSTFTGFIKKKMLRAGSMDSLKSSMENKTPIILQLVKLDKNVHPPKLRFSNLNIDSDEFDRSIVINALTKETQEKNKIHCELYENVKIINQKLKEDEIAHELRQIEKNVDKIDYESLIHKKFGEQDENEDDVQAEESEEDADLDEDEEGEDHEELEDKEIIIDHEAKLQFLKGLGIDMNKISADEQAMDVDDTINMAEEEISSKPSLKSSKKREREHIKDELKIRKTEEDIIENKLDNPESVEFYEKKILSDPNNSIFWIQYASYILDKLNLSAARKIFERAIKTINISLVKEKLNVWIAYMNLENTYGTKDSFKEVVERAVEVNEKKIVYKHLISIYRLSNKHDLAHEVYRLLLKNYFSDINIWKNYLEFLFELENLKDSEIDQKLMEKILKSYVEPKEGLKKALQTLNKSKNVEMLLAYGQLQYKYNHIEEARNTFESILKNYQKRSDIWMVYVEKEIKITKNLDKIRSIFERMLSVDFKLKALKNIIKKYMEFEKDYGTPKSLENVKNLTQKIISEKMRAYAEEDEGENEMEVENDDEM